MADIREVKEGLKRQGVDEVVTYDITTTPWGSSPTSPSVKVFSYIDYVFDDVTATVMPSGSVSVAGDVITLPPLRSLTQGVKYRVEVQFTVDGAAPGEAYFWVYGER